MKLVLAVLAVFMLLYGCAPKKQAHVPECNAVYTILPANFIIELAAGADITIDPAIQDFILFCRSEEAQKMLADSSLPGDWRVYEVAGKLEEIASVRPDGDYFLARPAQVIDWVAKPGGDG